MVGNFLKRLVIPVTIDNNLDQETLDYLKVNGITFYRLESLPPDWNPPKGWNTLCVDGKCIIYSEDINSEELNRLRKLLSLELEGLKPYGSKFETDLTLKEFKERYSGLQAGQIVDDTQIRVAGRILAKRVHGKASFLDIEDTEARLQLFTSKSDTERYDIIKKLIDVGDWIGVSGYPMKTKRGELSLKVINWTVLSKCLKPLPEKWHRLRDQELRYRQRYLDLIVNPESREKIITRAKLISFIRRYLESKGFLEVETPILSGIATGALARPFITYHNALGINLYLRIAPELYLKRLVVGHLLKVFEIGRVFRNEGISTRHNPEFTILELYQAFGDLTDMMKLAEDMIYNLALELKGSTVVIWNGKEIDLKPPYKRISFSEALKLYGDVDLDRLREDESYRREQAERWDLQWQGNLASLIDKLFETIVEPHLVEPTFVVDFPIELSPLAKRKENDPNLTERFELFIANFEIANAFSELNDPDDQLKRFLYQRELRKRGDQEAHAMDVDYIEALKYALPPTGGMGFGIDRLTMLFTDSQSIREVIAFPLLRPEAMERKVELENA